MDMRFGTWNVRSLYRSGSLMTIEKEISKYKLHLVGLQEVRWDRSGTKPAGKYIFSMESGKGIINYIQVFFFVHKRIISAVKRVEFVVIGCCT
jgi:hypothetical protein